MKAVFHTCRAMHASLSGKADGQQSSFCHCERASGHLWSSLNVSGATCDPTLNHVSGGSSGPSGRCSALLAKSTRTHLEPTRPWGCWKDRPGKQPLSLERSLLVQVGFLSGLRPSTAPPGSAPDEWPPAGHGHAFAPGSSPPRLHILSQPTLPGRRHTLRWAAVVHCSCIACSGSTRAVFPQCITEACPPSRDFRLCLVPGHCCHCWVTRQGHPGEGRVSACS